MKIKDLKPNPKNPRKISKEKKEMLDKSLKEFGDLSGIIYNKALDKLAGGHQRITVLPDDAEVVIEHVYDSPTSTGTVADGYILINDEKYSYRIVYWDEIKHDAATIAANQHGGMFEYSVLTDTILNLDTHNIDLDLLGFDQKELEYLLAPMEKKVKKTKHCPHCNKEI